MNISNIPLSVLTNHLIHILNDINLCMLYLKFHILENNHHYKVQSIIFITFKWKNVTSSIYQVKLIRLIFLTLFINLFKLV